MTAPESRNPPCEAGFGDAIAGQAGHSQHTPPRVDLQQAADFLRMLDAAPGAQFHFRTFPDQGSGSGRNFHGTLDEAAVQLQLDNGNTRGVFVVVNAGGQKKADITAVRAVFADFDDPAVVRSLKPEALTIDGVAPHAVIESSPGKMHAYWRIEGMPPADFPRAQKALAARLGSDTSVHDLSRVMRLPGFVHHKGQPFQTRIVHLDRHPPLTRGALAPLLAAPIANPLPTDSAMDGAVVEAGRHDDARNMAARLARLVAFEGMTRDAALAALLAERERGRWSRHIADIEIKRALDSAIAKCRSGDWRPTVREAPRTHRRALFTQIGELLARDLRPHWLVRGRLETDTLAFAFGAPGGGKTFICGELALCISTGTEFFGNAVKRGAVLYIAGEGHRGITRRAKAWSIARGIAIDEAPLLISDAAVPLTDSDALAELLAEVEACEAKFGTPTLIVVDTLSRSFGTGDENSTKDMTAFIGALDRLRIATKACVLVVHHTSKANPEAARGNGAARGAADWEYSVIADAGIVRLHCTKAKDFDPPADLCFRISGGIDIGVMDDEGQAITSAVLTPAVVLERATQGKSGRGKNQTAAMRALHELTKIARQDLQAQGLDGDDIWVAGGAWRARCIDVDRIPRQRFAELAKSLGEAGRVVIDGGRVRIGDPDFDRMND